MLMDESWRTTCKEVKASWKTSLMRFDLDAPDLTSVVHIWSKATGERSRRESLTHITDRERRRRMKEKQRRSKRRGKKLKC